MNHQAIAKKAVHPVSGAVNDLVRDDEVTRCQLFFEAACRIDGNDPLYPQRLEGVDICARWQLSWINAVSPAMSRKKGDARSFEPANDNRVARIAERCLNPHLFDIAEAFYLVEAGSPHDPDFSFWHWHLLHFPRY
ncbi:MAG: hypothetical protein DDT24_00108 [Chloroflexi bacterium]|nr:hypothetical protein [Chloroflexota bacterium]